LSAAESISTIIDMNVVHRQNLILYSLLGHVFVLIGALLVSQFELGAVKLHHLLIGLHGLLLLTMLWTGLGKWSQFCWLLIDASVWTAHDSSTIDLRAVMCLLILLVAVVSILLYATMFFQPWTGFSRAYENIATLMFPVILVEALAVLIALGFVLLLAANALSYGN
jgi:hypothetical protein